MVSLHRPYSPVAINTNHDSASLGRNDANDLLMALIDWYLKSLGAQNGMLVVRKLSSALATFFLHFPHLWRHFVRHLSLCLLCDQARDYSSLQESVDASTVFEQLQPPQIQAVLWVLINVLEDVAKVDLNSANKSVCHSLKLLGITDPQQYWSL